MNSDTLVTILAVTTGIAVAVRAAIPALRKIAEKTASKRDDEALTKLEVVLDYVIQALDIIRRMPRVVIGPFPSTQPLARSLPPRSGHTLPGPGPLGALEPMKPLSVPPPRGKDGETL